MTATVYTARVGPVRYADEFNITRATGEGDGLAFAPSWAILRPALDARREAAEHVAECGGHCAEVDGDGFTSADDVPWYAVTAAGREALAALSGGDVS